MRDRGTLGIEAREQERDRRGRAKVSQMERGKQTDRERGGERC